MPIPFDCIDLAFMLDSATSTLYTLNLVTGTRNALLKLSSRICIHALLFNDRDQLLYFYDYATHQLCQLDANGDIFICETKNLPPKSYQAITLSPDGQLYLYESLDTEWYSISLDIDSPKYLIAQSHILSPFGLVGWCMHPRWPYLHTLNTEGQLIQFDPITSDSTPLKTQGLAPLEHYQIFFDYDGLLYVVDLQKSIIYRLTLSAELATAEFFCKLDFPTHACLLSHSLLSPLLVSLGSAPAPYVTSIEANGPRHAYTHLLSLQYPNTINDASLVHQTYDLTVSLSNQTGSPAYLYGWVDWNQNGLFELSEALEPISVSSVFNTTQNITLHFDIPNFPCISLGQTYIRLRLTTDLLETQPHNINNLDTRSLGPASDGEILDLPMYITAPAPIAQSALYEKVLMNQVLESSISATDPCNGKLLFSVESFPSKGKISLDDYTGRFTYTPEIDVFAEDHFLLCATSCISHLSVSIPVQITIEKASLKIELVPSQTELTLQDTLTYTATLHNQGSLTLQHILFTACLPDGMHYQEESVFINGIKDLISLPTLGISLVKLLPSERCTISFTVTLDPSLTNQFAASCSVECNYSLSTMHPSSKLSIQESAHPCTLKTPALEMSLIANTDTAFLEDLVQYTATFQNTGDLPLRTINLSLAIPLEMQYMGDFTYDHTLIPSSLLQGYIIPYMAPGETHQLQFKASPVTSTCTASLTTILFANYTYILNQIERSHDNLMASHNLTLHQPSFSLTKQASKTAITPGECFIYTVEANNTSAVPIKEVILKESIPPFLQVLSIKQGNLTMPNTLETGMSIGNLPPYTSKYVDIALKVTDTSCATKHLSYPTTGIFKLLSGNCEKVFYQESTEDSNVLLSFPSLTLSKHTTTQEFIVGEIVSYQIKVCNTGTLPLTHIKIEDLLASELKFVSESVSLDTNPLPGASLISGVPIDLLEPGKTQTIAFDALLLSQKSEPITTTCSGYYHYLPFDDNKEKVGFAQSQAHLIYTLNPSLTLTGSVNASIAYLHDQLDYNFTITNTGDVDAFHVMIQNTCCCSTLIDGSFQINHQVIHSVELDTFISIGNLPRGATTTITFSTSVIGSPHYQDSIINSLLAQFMYYTCDHTPKYQNSPTFQLITPLTLSTFKQLCLEYSLEIPDDKPDLEVINTINGHVDLLKTYIIPTPKGTSLDGQTLTGYKLMVHALLKMTVQYTDAQEHSHVYTSYYELPFSTFIVLSEKTHPDSTFRIDSTVQNISWHLLNNRCFFTCASILMIAHLH